MAKIDFRKLDTYRKSFDGILQVKKHVGLEDDLPVTGAQNGDIYTVGDSNTLYMFNNGEWGTLGSGGSTDWNDITNKPFYTKTFPSIDLPNGIKLVIDGYVKDDAEVVDGKYVVTDTRFDIALINKADNTVLEKFVGVVPVKHNQTTSRLNMKASIYLLVHSIEDEAFSVSLEMYWSELAAFNEVVRSWQCILYAYYSGGSGPIGEQFFVPTPAKPSAVKGQDYDTVTVEYSLEGYTAYYKKADEVKKIDNKYLPDPYAALIINGNPVSKSTTEQLMAMGLTKEKIDAVVNGEISYVIVQRNKQEPQLYKVIYAGTDDGVYFICESTEFYSNSISYQRVSFGYHILDDGTPELYYYIEKDFSYPINASSEQGD